MAALPKKTHVVSEKYCGKCSETLPAASFATTRWTCDGLQNWCRECKRVYDNADHRKARRLAHAKNKWRDGSSRDKYYRRTFGVSLDDYNRMLHNQGSKCAICGVPQAECNRALAVDHCHTSDRVRGLLCSSCNTGLGNLKDDPMIIARAIDYLKAHEPKHYEPFTFCG